MIESALLQERSFISKRVWVQMQNAVLQYHHPRRDRHTDAIMALRTTPIKTTTTRKKGLLII